MQIADWEGGRVGAWDPDRIAYLMSKGQRGERIQSYDLEAVRELIDKKIKAIES